MEKDLKRKKSEDSKSKKVKTEGGTNFPKFLLKPGNQTRVFSDICNLLLWVFSEKEGKMPSWIFVQNKHLIEKIVVVIADGIDLDTLLLLKDSSPFLSALAKPEFTSVILNKTNSSFSMQSTPKTEKTPSTKTCISDYVHSETILVENNFLFNEEFKLTEEKELPDNQKIVGIDCEMVKCGDNLRLARVTVIDKDFNVLLDDLVVVEEPITDYLTKFSGITKEILDEAKSSLDQVREKVLGIIGKDTIVCGHSVENDLMQLGIRHFKIIDTSIIYPHPVPGYKHSLKYLTTRYLKRAIQAGAHNSEEDAIAALELVYLKVQRGPSFGLPSISKHENLSNILNSENKKIIEIHSPDEIQSAPSDTCIFILRLEDINHNFNFTDRLSEVSKILETWDITLKTLFEKINNFTGVIFLSSLGDLNYSDHVNEQRNLNFSTWKSEDELEWNKTQKQLRRTFGLFLFKSQVQIINSL